MAFFPRKSLTHCSALQSPPALQLHFSGKKRDAGTACTNLGDDFFVYFDFRNLLFSVGSIAQVTATLQKQELPCRGRLSLRCAQELCIYTTSHRTVRPLQRGGVGLHEMDRDAHSACLPGRRPREMDSKVGIWDVCG